ncbi:MAG: helix-turn-helix domain-containing protein, partial [bacterium]|nr:helix-turn-helix domain-containing protein [bacterium]
MLRILIIVWADKSETIARTAELLGCCEQSVLNWRKRFLERRAKGPVAA